MSLVTLFARRLPPPCWLRAYQTSSARLCNPKTPAAAPVPPVIESKEPVSASTPIESDKPIKEDNIVHQSAVPSEPVKPIEPSEPPAAPAKSTTENVNPEPPTPAAATPAAAAPVQAPLPPQTKEPAPEQSKGPVAAPANPPVPSPSILSAITGLRHSPAPALGLGLAGLIPFVAAPAYMYNAGVFLPSIATAQLTYGATILSFLGGVRWGLLASGGPHLPPSWSQYSWSVTPSLVAWAALLIPNQAAATTLCAAGLTTALVLDLKQQGYPDWFRGLRLILTLGAVVSLLCSLGLSMGIGITPLQSTLLT